MSKKGSGAGGKAGASETLSGSTGNDAVDGAAGADSLSGGGGGNSGDELVTLTLEGGAGQADAVERTREVADEIATAATPVVRVTAVRDRWRAKRFWPKGDTDLTEAEAMQLGREGFEQLRGDNVFTIVPLDRAD